MPANPFCSAHPHTLTIVRTGKSLCQELFVANNHFSLGLGLMFRRLGTEQGMVFLLPKKRRVSLHMLFVFSSLDVLFANRVPGSDDCLVVVSTITRLKPFMFSAPSPPCDLFVEFRAGTLKHLKAGDTIRSSKPSVFSSEKHIKRRVL